MGISRTLYGRVNGFLAPFCPQEDRRRTKGLAWLVTGLLLEQDARLSCVAVAMDSGATADANERRLQRLLAGPLDIRTCYRALLQKFFEGWTTGNVTLMIDTSSVRGRVYFVRVALAHAEHAIPLCWRSYKAKSATLPFVDYVELLEEVDSILPRRFRRTLLADRGFQHLHLIEWCEARGWRYRIRAKLGLGIWLPDDTFQKVRDFRSQVGERRLLDTVYLGSRHVGPAGLMLCWPRYGPNRTLHVLSPDPPTDVSLWEFSKLGAIERAFRNDKSACFGIERTRITDPHRLDRLLLGIAITQVLLVSLATRLIYFGNRREVDAHYDGGLSLLQLGARAFRASVYRGRTPKLHICVVPDDFSRPRGLECRRLKAFYYRMGIKPGQRWIPPDSFESRNSMWWLPGQIRRFPPRFPEGDPLCPR